MSQKQRDDIILKTNMILIQNLIISSNLGMLEFREKLNQVNQKKNI